jgi:hypothetical protein
MKKTIIVFIILLLTACSSKKNISDVLQNKFETRTLPEDLSTSSPDLNEGHRKEILVLLHYNFTQEKIKEYFNMSDSIYNVCINDLFGKGLIKKTSNGNFVPACMVIDAEEGKTIKKTADSLGREMSGIAIDRLDKIKSAYSKISSFKNYSFEDASLFILGNVLHNYWQMKFIEERFIKSFPPMRGTARYYMALLQSQNKDGEEPFGLYNKRSEQTGKYKINYYGNRFNADDKKLTEREVDQFVKNEKLSFPLIKDADQKKLDELSLIITQDVLNYLEKNRPLFVKLYLNSVYKDQTSFREWFVWFYQFMITQTTNTLIEKGFIRKHSSGNTFYVLISKP